VEVFLKLNYGTLILIALSMPVLAVYLLPLAWTVSRIAGLIIAVPAFILFIVARIQLGKAFSLQAKASILVTTGIYSRIRNPIYIFGGLVMAGIILCVNLPWLLLVFAVLIPMQIYRSRNEERVLTEKFGAAYLDYKRQTWF
jgi:protein-S-isoprenylcysteine O-methyltransferase Ste14